MVEGREGEREEKRGRGGLRGTLWQFEGTRQSVIELQPVACVTGRARARARSRGCVKSCAAEGKWTVVGTG